MELKLISKEELSKFVNAIIESGVETYGVQDKEPDKAFNKYHFAPLTKAENLCLDYDVTLTPPKAFFTPAKETLFKFSKDADVKLNPVYDTNKKVIIGIHPYDMIAVNQMDEVFKKDCEDAHYFKRRKNAVIIGVDPEKASSWAFWCHMDASTVDTGYDLWLTKLDDSKYILEIKSETGAELVKKHAIITDATEEDTNKRDSIRVNLHKHCNADRKLSAKPGEIPLLVKEHRDDKFWEEKASKCYSCGSCNLVCPTCYCFDVQDDIELNLKDGERMRKWDGCQLQDFAAVGTGENFREHKTDRYKHRFYRKTLYLYQKFNHLACVGCGRCSSVCLPNIADPVDIINTMKEAK